MTYIKKYLINLSIVCSSLPISQRRKDHNLLQSGMTVELFHSSMIHKRRVEISLFTQPVHTYHCCHIATAGDCDSVMIRPTLCLTNIMLLLLPIILVAKAEQSVGCLCVSVPLTKISGTLVQQVAFECQGHSSKFKATGGKQQLGKMAEVGCKPDLKWKLSVTATQKSVLLKWLVRPRVRDYTRTP